MEPSVNASDCWLSLEVELAELLADPPPYVRRVGTLRAPRAVVQDGELRLGDAREQLDLSVVIRADCKAYGCPLQVRFRFSTSWPEKPPIVRFRSRVEHWLVDNGGELLQPFYAALTSRSAEEGAEGRFTLRSMLAVLHGMLLDPQDIKETVGAALSSPLSFAHGAARYSGFAEHPSLGPGRTEVVLKVYREVGPDRFEGRWEAMGSAGAAEIEANAESHMVAARGETPFGNLLLQGLADPDSGTLTGECILGEAAGGVFELLPAQAGGEAVEIERRNALRLDIIRRYAVLQKHPSLFAEVAAFRDDWLDPAFLCARASDCNDAWRGILTEHLPGQVFSFQLFTEEFCELFVEEILSFYASGLPARRPNSMNRYGVAIGEIGLEPFVHWLQDVLQPLGEALWPGPGTQWDGEHCFIIRYRQGEDLGLDMHTDDSDVTFNICLGLSFTGAGLQFCGMAGAPDHRKASCTYHHARGRCVIHLGKHRHGADDITSGERMNLVLWNHSSAYRQSRDFDHPAYSAEQGPPDPVCLSYTHDRDFGVFRQYTPEQHAASARAWCPPKQAEYSNFTTGP